MTFIVIQGRDTRIDRADIRSTHQAIRMAGEKPPGQRGRNFWHQTRTRRGRPGISGRQRSHSPHPDDVGRMVGQVRCFVRNSDEAIDFAGTSAWQFVCFVKKKMQEFREREIAGNELYRIFAKELVCRYDKNYRLVLTQEFGPWQCCCWLWLRHWNTQQRNNPPSSTIPLRTF